jgi:hypothetical protein
MVLENVRLSRTLGDETADTIVVNIYVRADVTNVL